MRIADIIAVVERFAPPSLQESYDNAGLIAGDPDWEARGALLSLDCTEDVVEEALSQNCNLIISHHPILFRGVKTLSPRSYVQRTLIKAIKNDVAIYACHTNLDNVSAGVNRLICEKLSLKNIQILLPKEGILRKLVTFVPQSYHSKVLDALFAAGAGQIGKYDSCSFNIQGEGTFRGNEESNPFIGEPGKLSKEPEVRIEVILEEYRQKNVIKALLSSHPYEEVAYDVYRLENSHQLKGSGMIGELEKEEDVHVFLQRVARSLKTPVLKHTAFVGKAIRKVAVCGGSGSFLLKNAMSAGADAFVTGDFKYHELFDAEGRILVVDAGHYETEQFTPEIFYRLIQESFSTFAVHLSQVNTNPVYYFQDQHGKNQGKN